MAKFLDCIKIIAKNQLQISVRMPDSDPHNAAREWFNTCVQAQTKLEPFIVLVDCKQIIYTRGPESPSSKATCLMLADKTRFKPSKI
jgi:hypothetical protein